VPAADRLDLLTGRVRARLRGRCERVHERGGQSDIGRTRSSWMLSRDIPRSR
jgi:hypothetical protein